MSSADTNEIQLLVLDLDGTLVDKTDQIQEAVLHAVQKVQRQGIAVVLATGRGFQLSLPIYETVGSALPLICFEGALIREPRTGLIHQHWSLANRVATRVVELAEVLSRSNDLSVHFYIQDSLYVSKLNDATVNYFAGSQLDPVVVDDVRALLDQSITKVRVLSEDAKLVEDLSAEFQHSDSRVRTKEYRSLTFLELSHPAVNKQTSVSYLTENILGLRRENVMAIGNDFADVEMLRYAGLGVAMGNAPEEVKAAADWVTTSIEKDGVATALDHWILNAKPAINYRTWSEATLLINDAATAN